MEYSPNCAIPYVARVDAGTIELVRKIGAVEVVSSGDLIQRFAAVWNDRDIETHRAASEKLYRIKDRAFEEIRRRIAERIATTEYDIQQKMMNWFGEEELVSDSPPNVSVSENARNPHYLPTASVHQTIGPEQLVLLDLWGKIEQPGAVFADITWMRFGFKPLNGVKRSPLSPQPDAAVILSAGGVGGTGVAGLAGRPRPPQQFCEVRGRTGLPNRPQREAVHGNSVNMDIQETR